jgi:thiol-disulfide isomerase/thioredoxin
VIPRRRQPVAAVAAAVASAALLAGCSGDGPLPTAPDLATDVDVDTPALRHIRHEADMAGCPEVDGEHSDLPAVTLPCLGGGPDVALAGIEGPAVIPVWAQWCGPCREELPWFEQLHQAAGDRLTVLGVNWQDVQPEGALTFAAEAGVTFPSVADPDGSLRDGGRGLPLLYLVDEDGDVTLRRGQVDDYEQLVGLVEDHTGVPVAAG